MGRNIINVEIPEGWHKRLKRLANVTSLAEDETVNLSDLVRRALWAVYSGSLGQLTGSKGEK
jgi:hypothetical protein